MASVEERVIAVTARILKIDPSEIKLGDAFTTDLGAESVQSIELLASKITRTRSTSFSASRAYSFIISPSL